jgi:hypothetical protein
MCSAAPKQPASPQTNAAILAATGQVPIRMTSKKTLKQQNHPAPAPTTDPLTIPNIPGLTDTTTNPANAAEMLWNVPLMTPKGMDWVYNKVVLPSDQAAPEPNLTKLKGFREFNGKVQGIPLFRGAVANDSQLDPLVLDQRKGLPSGIGFSQLRRDLTFPTGGR